MLYDGEKLAILVSNLWITHHP